MQTKLFELPDIDLTKATETIIRALWWKQPFASLMLHGKIETRTYPTKVRGKVLICTTLNPFNLFDLGKICGAKIFSKIFSLFNIDPDNWPHVKLPMGKAIAIGDLVDCRKMTPQDEDRCFVEYNDQRWCWVFENVEAIEPFEIKGKQGWAILSEEEKLKIKILKPQTI